MLSDPLFRAQFAALVGVAALHITALSFSLYWHFVWLDTLTHFLGGVWVALAVMWAVGAALKRPASPLAIIAAALGIGIAWEIFEIVIGIPREANFVFDTALDLSMDVVGGFVGYVIGSRLTS